MKAILTLLALLVSSPVFAYQASDKVSCMVAYSYAVKIDLKNNTADLWEIAVSVGSVIGEDKVIAKKKNGNTFTYQLQNTGAISITFDQWDWGRGTWNHKGVLNKLLADADDRNANGVVELSECVFE